MLIGFFLVVQKGVEKAGRCRMRRDARPGSRRRM